LTGNDGLSHRTYSMRKGRTFMRDQDKPAALVRAVAGIDAAITARHHIAVREVFDGTEHLGRFTVNPTLAGLERFSQRLAAVQTPLTAVVEPIWMTWLALASLSSAPAARWKRSAPDTPHGCTEPLWARTNPTSSTDADIRIG
jgi:hypothetical protein